MDKLALKFITEQDVSEITGIALSTLRNDRFHKRGIPYIKIRRSVRYDLKDVLKYMEEHKVVTESWPNSNRQNILITK